MSAWNEYLQASGAKLDERFGRYYGDLAQEAQTTHALIDAGHLAVIGISGPEAEAFLQGQLTCDVREVDNTHFRLGAWCSAKGRVQTSFWLARAWDQYLLIMDASLIESIQTALKKYILFSKAKMELREDLAVLGWGGNNEALAAQGVPIPAPGEAISNEGFCTLDLGGRLLMLATEANAQTLWQSAIAKVGCNLWKLLDIRAGIALINLAGKDVFLPQNLNFDLIGGVNFKKGCYIGQEIVARLHWKGQAKNRATRFSCADLALQPGQVLHNESGRALGEVVHVALNENNELELLVNIRLDALQDSITIHANAPTQLRALTLPYAIPSTEASHSSE